MIAWHPYKIGQLGRVVTGKTPPSTQPKLFLGEIPFLTPSDMSDDGRDVTTERFVSTDWDPKRRQLLPEGSTCVVCIGATIGKVCMISRPSHTNQQVNSIVVDTERFDQGFVFYSMRTLGPELRARAAGAATPIINKTSFSEITIWAPPLDTQRRIASILGAYDDLIEVNRRRVAVLEEMARGLFEEWFVRFRFPGNESVPLVDTPDGPLPQGWDWRAFSSLAEFMNGFAFKPSHFEADGWPIIKIPELKNGITQKTPRNNGAEVPEKYQVENGDLLFSWSGTFAISDWTSGLGLLNQHLFLVRPETGVERGLLKAALRWAIPLFDNQGVGATMKHIRRSALDHTKIPYPKDGRLLDRANGLFRSSYKLCVNFRRQTQELAASRDLLLPRLISGQLSVEAAERDLELAA